MKVLAERPISVERPARTISGVPILALNLATCVTVPFILVDGFRMADWPSMIGGVLVLAAMFIMWRGFFTVGPNECWIVMAWGSYRGTVREQGLHWVSPFALKTPVSLRARSLSVDRLKMHDNHGAPIEMAAVIEWRVIETARASFDVHCVDNYVRDQCESAVRHFASNISDTAYESPVSTRRNVEQLQQKLQSELQGRVARAGVTIDEVRLTQRCEHWTPVRATIDQV
jgi:regulator of protease activity HflC (stomatin/prohibitin superfamily)